MTLSLFATAATLPGMAAPALEWSRRLGTFAHAMPFLRETASCASALHCPVGCGCDHEVVQDSDDMLRAVCVCEDSGGCADILVPRAQLRVLQLNVEKVAREIARALNCRPVLASLGVSGLWQAGAWSTAGVPLLLCLTLDGGALSRAIAECAARLDGRFILLVPEPAAANARARELLRGSALLRLEDVVRPSAPGRFQPAIPPEHLFAAFTTDIPDGVAGSVRAAFALIEKLDTNSPVKAPGLLTVFKLYCMDELTTVQIARKCKCSKTTIIERLARIRKETGIEPLQFRRMSGHLDAVAERLTDPRAANLSPRYAAD